MSFTQGVSGLNAASAGLNTIGNNIANSQTVGYKTGRTEFGDLYAGAKTGLGVSISAVTQDFNSGSLETTGRDLDLAIDGTGFFRLTDGNRTVYSRDGQFQQTKDGYLANSGGAKLTGYNVSNFNDPNNPAQISATGNPQPIQLPAQGLIARATTQASLQAALDAGSSIKSADAIKTSDATTYDYATPNSVYDSLGNAHNVNLYFTKTGENQWQVNGEMQLGAESKYSRTVVRNGDYPGDFNPSVTGNGNFDVTVGTGDAAKTYAAKVTGAVQGADGSYSGGNVSYTETLPATTLKFTAAGNLVSAEPADGSAKDGKLSNSSVAYALDAQNGSAPITFDFDFAGSSQTAQSFSAGSPAQDGYASGTLTGIAIGGDGTVRGTYSNGQSVNLAQVALASFRNEQGLEPLSGNVWAETSASGQAALGTAGNGSLGNLLGGTLEESNVDLSAQLVNMIVAQRNYQANAQTIKTQDEILQTVVNIA